MPEILPQKEISSSRWKYGLYLTGALLFVAIGVLMILKPRPGSDPTMAFAILGFFSFCSLTFLWMLIRPQRLVLDKAGFTLSGGFIRSPQKIPWTDIQSFYVYGLPRGGRMIGYDFQPGAKKDSTLININRRFGAEAALPRGWPMSVDELADLLNFYQAAASASNTSTHHSPSPRSTTDIPSA